MPAIEQDFFSLFSCFYYTTKGPLFQSLRPFCVLNGTMDHCMDMHITDWGRIKTDIKDALGDFVWKEMKRRPMIIPIIMEV